VKLFNLRKLLRTIEFPPLVLPTLWWRGFPVEFAGEAVDPLGFAMPRSIASRVGRVGSYAKATPKLRQSQDKLRQSQDTLRMHWVVLKLYGSFGQALPWSWLRPGHAYWLGIPTLCFGVANTSV